MTRVLTIVIWGMAGFYVALIVAIVVVSIRDWVRGRRTVNMIRDALSWTETDDAMLERYLAFHDVDEDKWR